MNVPASILEPLQEGIVNKVGGEVVVRGGPHKARIYVFNGQIAWITCDTIKTRLGDVLLERADLTREDLEAAIQESQTTRRNFGETLMQWKLIDQSQLRDCLLHHNAAHFRGLIGFGASAQAMFIPQERKYSGQLLYSLEEIVRACGETESKRASGTRVVSPSNDKLRSALTVVPACKYSFFFSEENGTMGCFPEDAVSPETLQNLVRSIGEILKNKKSVSLGSGSPTDNGTTEVILLNDNAFCLARRCKRLTGSVFGVVCDEVRNLGLSMGMARNTLRAVCEETADQES